MSVQFDQQLKDTKSYFTMLSGLIDAMYPGANEVRRLYIFSQEVKTGATYDLKNGAYSKDLIGPISLYHGEKLLAGDYGQINYGVAAKAFGINLSTAVIAAGLNQIAQGKPDWRNPSGFFDGREETPMIIRGYNMTIK